MEEDNKHTCKWCEQCTINSDNRTGKCYADIGCFIPDINKDCGNCPDYVYDKDLERY